MFSNQNYFDEAGLFISVVLSGPLLIVNMAIVVRNKYSASITFSAALANHTERERSYPQVYPYSALACDDHHTFFCSRRALKTVLDRSRRAGCCLNSFFPSYLQVNHLIVLSGLVVRAKAAELKAKARKKAKESKKKK